MISVMEICKNIYLQRFCRIYFLIVFVLANAWVPIHAAVDVDTAIPQQQSDEKEETQKQYLERTWYKSTFPTTMASVRYHTKKHGNGRSSVEYTEDAMKFYKRYKHLGKPVVLHDGKNTPGIKIKRKQAGGYWTSDGRLVTYWD